MTIWQQLGVNPGDYGYDPDDYDEPENRCHVCGAFIRKTPEVTYTGEGDIKVEHLDITCKRCGQCYYHDQWAFTPWGSIDLDYLRDGNGDWISDRAEIERIVKKHNPRHQTDDIPY